MSSALQLIDITVLNSVNSTENKIPELLHKHRQVPLNNPKYDSLNRSTLTFTSTATEPQPPAKRKPLGSATLSKTALKEGRRFNILNLPESMEEAPMLVAEKTNQSPVATRSSDYKKKIKKRIKLVFPTQWARRLRTRSQETTSAQRRIMRASGNEINLLKLLQNAMARKKAVYSLNSLKVETPLTDALKQGIELIEKFERGKMAQREFMENWMIMNDIIQNAIKEQRDILNDTFKEALREDKNKTQHTEMNAESLMKKLQYDKEDKHFVAYRYRPTTKSKDRTTTKTFKIYAAYKASNNTATQEGKTNKEEETMNKGLPDEIGSQDEGSEQSEGKIFRQAHVHQPEAVKGLKVSNGTQDKTNSYDSTEDDIPWKQDSLTNSDTDEKYSTSTSTSMSTSSSTPVTSPTALIQVEWVTHQRKSKQSTMPKEELPEKEQNDKVQQDYITAQKDNGKTSQEVEYEEVLKNFNMLRQRNYEESLLQNEQTPENVEVDFLVSQDSLQRAIGNSYIRNMQVDPQREIMDSSPDELVKEHPELFVLNSPTKGSDTISMLIDAALQSNENTPIELDLDSLPIRRTLRKTKTNQTAPGKKKNIKTVRSNIATPHVIETRRNDVPVRAEDNAEDWDEMLNAAIRRTEARGARYSAAGGVRRAAGARNRRHKRARKASSVSNTNRTVMKRRILKNVTFKH